MGKLLRRPAEIASRALRQRSVLGETEHRPWPTPTGQWLMGQTWDDLLFAHWRLAPDTLRAVVPAELSIDTFDGDAWLGVTPFVVNALRLHGTPPIPFLSSFPEINVRTYVTVGGKPGIYFFSLDADSRFAVASARRFYRLPYFRARMAARRAATGVDYRSRRTSADGPAASFAATYAPRGDTFTAEPGSLDYFLTERYCLYTFDDSRRVQRAEIHHPPWPLQRAAAEISENRMGEPVGLALEGEPVFHFSRRQDVAIWPLAPVAPAGD